MKRVVIIGGGITGLAVAHRLVELSSADPSSFQITLLEAGPSLGGIIQTEERDDFLIERGPDSFISEKPQAINLARRLGLESRLIQTNESYRRSFIVRNGRLRPVPEGFQLLAPAQIWPFITSDIFSVSGKLRMALDLVLPRKTPNGVDDESLASFVRRRLGREALERMGQPMVGGIYTADPEKLSLRATLPRFLNMERDHRSVILAMLRRGGSKEEPPSTGVSGARYSLFLSFDGGMKVLVDEIARRLTSLPQVTIKRDTRVLELERTGQSWCVRTQDGQSLEADCVSLAVPAYIAASLLRDVNPNLATMLSQIQFASTATVNLAYRRSDILHPLDGFGFVVPFVEKRSLIACTFSSIKFPGRAPANHVLLRAFVGGALQPEMFELDEEEMLHRVRKDLGDLLGVNGAPLFTQIAKWTKSMPQYEVGHMERVALLENEIRQLTGLSLVGNSYHGAGIPDCIRSGETAAESMVTSLNNGPLPS